MRPTASATFDRSADRVTIGGIELHRYTEAGTVGHIMTHLKAGSGGWIITPNVDICRQIRRDPQVGQLVNRATLAVADGMPLVWASRLKRQPLPERVTGSSLIFSLSEAAADASCSIFLLGGAPGAPESAARKLSALYPKLKIVGTESPPFGFEHDKAQLECIRDRLLLNSPDIVFVGLGFPKQEKLISLLSPTLPATWFVGCGAAIGFAGGTTRRAPQWIQRCGMEWLHRLGSEPRRLFKRYVIHDLPYAAYLLITSCVSGVAGKL